MPYGINYLSPSHLATSALSMSLTEPARPLVLVPFLLAVFVCALRAYLVSNTWRARTRRRLPEPTGHTCTRPLARDPDSTLQPDWSNPVSPHRRFLPVPFAARTSLCASSTYALCCRAHTPPPFLLNPPGPLSISHRNKIPLIRQAHRAPSPLAPPQLEPNQSTAEGGTPSGALQTLPPPPLFVSSFFFEACKP
jgi:hypothetical protein